MDHNAHAPVSAHHRFELTSQFPSAFPPLHKCPRCRCRRWLRSIRNVPRHVQRKLRLTRHLHHEALRVEPSYTHFRHSKLTELSPSRTGLTRTRSSSPPPPPLRMSETATRRTRQPKRSELMFACQIAGSADTSEPASGQHATITARPIPQLNSALTKTSLGLVPVSPPSQLPTAEPPRVRTRSEMFRTRAWHYCCRVHARQGA